MAVARFTLQAEADLQDIAAYTASKWGLEQAILYLDELHACCNRLAEKPLLGRRYEMAHLSLRRFEQGRHVIFYLQEDYGILIVRVLHQRMLPLDENFRK